MKFKKTLLAMGTAATVAAPIAAVVSCGTTSSNDQMPNLAETSIVAGYWPDVDPLLALGAPLKSASKGSGFFTPWINTNEDASPNTAAYADEVSKLYENKPLWDSDNMDEEYWRNRNNGDKFILAHEYWIKGPQKDFIKSDPKITGIQLDYNAGVAGEQYTVPLTDGKANMVFENVGTENYKTPGDLWQIRSMDEIVKTAASELDRVITGKDFAAKAAKISTVTDKHWNQLNQLKEGRKADFVVPTDNHYTVTPSDGNALLVLNIDDGEDSMDNVSVSTVSNQSELYTKTAFNMPEYTPGQAQIISKYNGFKLGSDGKTIHGHVASETANGVYFPGYKQDPIVASFWKPWEGKMDKILIGIPRKYTDTEAHKKAFWADHSSIKTEIAKLLKDSAADSWDKNTLVLKDNLVGNQSYGFRMPIGQNVFIDDMINAWYKPAATDAAATAVYNASKIWTF